MELAVYGSTYEEGFQLSGCSVYEVAQGQDRACLIKSLP